MSRVCYEDRQHVLLVALYGAPFAIVFCLGVIALFTVQIARYQLYKQRRQEELRYSTATSGGTVSRTDRFGGPGGYRYHVVLRGSGAGTWVGRYWHCLQLGMLLLLVLIKVIGYSVLNTNKLLVISLLLMLQFGLLLRYRPYSDTRLNTLELTVAGTNLVIC